MSIRWISTRSFLMSVAAAGCMWASAPASSATAVAAKAYGLNIQHIEQSRLKREKSRDGLQLQLTLTNSGPHNLYDVRLFLLSSESKILDSNQEPVRVRRLKTGEQTVLTGTFEVERPVFGKAEKGLRFRIEAVDEATKQIVTFQQQSTVM